MKKKDKVLKLRLSPYLVNFVKKQAKRHKMSLGQYLVYVIKVSIRRNPDKYQIESDFLLFSTKEARAYRRDYIYDKSV